MEKTKVLRLLVSVVLVLALTMSLMACQQKEPDPTPTPSETVKPSETTKPTETTKPSETTHPSETTEPTETPEPTETAPGGLLNDEFWNWYSQGGNHIEYSELSTLTGSGSYVVDAINETGDVAITNTEFTGTVKFGEINVAGSLTLNMPNATIVFDSPASVGALNVTSGSHTFVLNAQLTITTSSGKLTISGGNAEINAPVVTNDETPSNAVIYIPGNGTITTSVGVTLEVNGGSLTIIVNTNEDISIKTLNDITIDTRNRSAAANKVSVDFAGASGFVSEIKNAGDSAKVEVTGSSSANPLKPIEAVTVKTEAELATAIANDNAIITLGANIALTSPAHFDYMATLDLNGYTLSLAETYTSDDYLLAVKRGGNLTVKDSSKAQTGMINGGGKVAVKLTISGEGAGTSSTAAYLTIESGTIYTTDMFAIAGNGDRNYANLTINGGTIKSEYKNQPYYAAIFMPQNGNVTINGGTIEGYAAALEVRSGVVTINGGTFKATAPSLTVKSSTSGSTTIGAAFAIAQHSTKNNILVSINAGSFEGYAPVSITNPQYATNGKTNNVNVTINGGTFTSTNRTATACDVYVDDDAVSAYFIVKNASINITLPANYNWTADNKIESNNETISSGVVRNKTTGDYEISSKDGLVWFEQQVNKNKKSFGGVTVKLTADIDMGGAAWTPIGQNDKSFGPYGADNNTVEFKGTFDGNGKTIKNFTITSVDPTTYLDAKGNAVYSVGFFGYVSGGTIKDVTFENVTVTGYHYMGVVAGYIETKAEICNVVVKNCTVNGSHKTNDYCGDKIGGIVGFVNQDCVIKNCQISNTTITAGRDAGQVAGYADFTECVTGCTATNVTVSADTTTSCTGANINNTLIGRLG